jgi:hypothetical protein
MARLPIIDADSHVEECEATWSYLEPKYRDRRPIHLNLSGTPGLPRNDSYWLIDGRIHARPGMPGSTQSGSPVSSTLARGKSFTLGSQTLDDVPQRLRDIDKFGIDISVLFPTAVLTHLTPDPDFEAALMRSYNTWMAGVCKQRPERLKFAAVMPLRSVPEAVAEVKRAKDLGAVGAAVYGTIDQRMLHHRDLDPFWAAAERLEMPICVHTGWSHPGLKWSIDSVFGAHTISFTLPVMMGFFSFLGGGILDRFPRLRVAFLEAGADWVPYLVQRLDHYFASERLAGWWTPERSASEYLRDCQIYFTCEAEERLLPQVLEFAGEDRIMMSADMPHAEARENAVSEIEKRTDLTREQKARILGKNAITFYSLSS